MPDERILVIEDEKDVVSLLEYNLKREGYEFISARTGEEGFATAKSKSPDLILLDLMLPTIDGLEVCRLLKQESSTRSIPVLILTAKNSEIDHVLGLELGAVDYLTKPFSIKVLLARIKNALRQNDRRESIEGPLRRGDFVIDDERMQFLVKGQPVTLTKKEFGIMRCLMARPSCVVSRDALAESVWGRGALVSPVAVNMHVKSLRTKLKNYKNAVETVRGFGYRFNA